MRTLKKYLSSIAIISMLVAATALHAEDIDIYDASAGSSSNPNILIILDNSANWAANNQGWPDDPDAPAGCGNSCKSKQGYYEVKALRTLISGLATSYGDSSGNVPINVGLQMFNETNASPKGTYIRSAVVPMTAANRTALINKLDNIIANFNTETSSASVQYSIALFDAFKYYGGYSNPANATADTQPAGVTASSPSYSGVPVFGAKYWGSPTSNSYDTAAYNGSNFNPISTTSCGRNYIVFIGNGLGASESNSEDLKDILAKLINPANPPSTIAQFPVNNYTCSNVTSPLSLNLGCIPSTLCSTTLTAALTTSLLTNTTGTLYQCNPGNCGTGTNLVLQACTVTSTGVPTGNATNRYADEFTDFLYRTDVSSQTGQQNVTTYTVDVYRNAPDPDQTALMRSMAKYGGGKYYAASDLTQLSKAFDSILAEIQSVNSVFASSSLPVSVNAQGTYLNQVFVGMFRPDTTGAPRWFGNLKQYQFSIFGTDLRLADFSGTPQEAISAETGFITPCAVSAWSTDTGSYWQYSPTSAGLCNAATKFSDAPDGATVEKGGAAQRLRGVSGSTTTSTQYSTRALKTCDGSCSGGLTNFDTSNTNVTASLSADLVNWVRGQDVDNENNTSTYPNTVTNEVRPSVHGGVVHSQPAVVDYGGSIGVVSYYGADDGVFHAVNGNKTSTDGNELWGFIAPESYSKLNRLRQNSPLIKYPSFSSTISPTPLSKEYFFDGSVGVFQRSGTVWIYPTMRRGGRAIYAFNVTTPSAPSLKWRAGCYTNDTTADTTCTGGWSAIGQTWSKPQVAYLSGYLDSSNNPKPVLVFGGGYDTCEDTDNQTRCTSTPRKGANIWFVDADTGAIIRTYPTNYSVPGEITLIKNAAGYVTYAYAADTGGYVYRINVGTYNGTTFTSWTSNSAAANITIASLSETNQARKFFFGPDVVLYAGFNTVNIGSGDREHPLISSYACNNFGGSGVKNQFYILKDRPPAYPASVITPSSLTDVTTNFAISESSVSSSGLLFNLVDPSNSGTLRCEQAVNKALTIGGVVYFGSNAPKSSTDVTSTCGINLGNARGYAVDFLTGAPVSGNSRSVVYRSGGLPPSPVAGIVDINGTKQPFCIGCTNPGDPNPSPLQGTHISINPAAPRQRLYWYLNED